MCGNNYQVIKVKTIATRSAISQFSNLDANSLVTLSYYTFY